MSFEQIREARQKMSSLLADMRSINDLSEKENRGFTADEKEQYTKLEADFDGLEEKTERLQREEQRAASIADDLTPTLPVDISNVETSEDQSEETAFRSFLHTGINGITAAEKRALQADADIYGGYVVAPQKFVNALIKAVDNAVYMRGAATTHKLNKAASMGVPSLDNDPADPTWTAEILTGAADSTMSFGKRELNPHPLAQRILVSNTLLQRGTIGVEALVRDRLSYKIGVVQENAFLNGTGNNQPLGVFTASDDGITTSQDVSTGNSTTAIATDGLINALYDMKMSYHSKSTWIFHRDAIKMIRKLKDGDGQYIWNAGITNDRPGTILGRPYIISEYAPNTFTTGQYVGLVGDMKQYWIVDALSMQVQRLVELYAATNQVGFISRLETDGMPVLAEAFRRVKLA